MLYIIIQPRFIFLFVHRKNHVTKKKKQEVHLKNALIIVFMLGGNQAIKKSNNTANSIDSKEIEGIQ